MEATAHKYEFMYGAQFEWLVESRPDTDNYTALCSLHNLK